MIIVTLQVGAEPGIRLPVRAGETLEAALTRCGFARLRKGCRRGGCGQCLVTVTAGAVADEKPIADTVLSPAQRAIGGALACRSIPLSDLVVQAEPGQIRCVSPLQRTLAERELARAAPAGTNGRDATGRDAPPERTAGPHRRDVTAENAK